MGFDIGDRSASECAGRELKGASVAGGTRWMAVFAVDETVGEDSNVRGVGRGDVGDVGKGAYWTRGSSCISQWMPKSAPDVLGFFGGDGRDGGGGETT